MESGDGEAPGQMSSGGALEVLVTAGPTTASNEAPAGEGSLPGSPRWEGEKLSFLKRASRKLRQRCAGRRKDWGQQGWRQEWGPGSHPAAALQVLDYPPQLCLCQLWTQPAGMRLRLPPPPPLVNTAAAVTHPALPPAPLQHLRAGCEGELLQREHAWHRPSHGCSHQGRHPLRRLHTAGAAPAPGAPGLAGGGSVGGREGPAECSCACSPGNAAL